MIFPDNDGPGFQHAANVAGSLLMFRAKNVRICRLPGEPKSDVSDFLATHSVEVLQKRIEAAVVYKAGD